MAIWGIPTFAVVGAARLLFAVLDKNQWLPSRSYRQKAINRLKDGDLQGAGFCIRLLLQRNPDDHNSQILQDLLAMRRDAQLHDLEKKIKKEEEFCHSLQESVRQNRQVFAQSCRRHRQQKLWPPAAVLVWWVSAIAAIRFMPLMQNGIFAVAIVGMVGLYLWLFSSKREQRLGAQQAQRQALEQELLFLQKQVQIRQEKIRRVRHEMQMLAASLVVAGEVVA
ncbi:MAG TPA: hypothetical protein PKW76_07010 [bacterium]|nr:hypothetical protein [bacterium]HPG45412.1 hypothetical protein [bacterium]HPM96812.1 hypothetical protein [bacterium]